MLRCYLSLGGNQGNVRANFDFAMRTLASSPGIHAAQVSRFIETAPVGDDLARFLNAVAEIDTTLTAPDLLALTQQIEDDCGRVRSTYWGPRPLDIDLILYGQDVIDTPWLNVPHPACWYRQFVLDPLVEIAPNVIHPVKQMSAVALRGRLMARPFHLSIAGATDRLPSSVVLSRLRSEFPDVLFTNWSRRDTWLASNPEPTLIVWFGGHTESTSHRAATGSFEALPLASRLDASGSPEPSENFLRHVLQAALNR